MAKELTLQQISRDRTTVDRHKGLPFALRVTVQAARHHLFTGSRFPKNQYIGI